MPWTGRHVLAIFLSCAAMTAGRLPAAGPDNGFSTLIRSTVTGEEIRSQKDLWALEVSVKSMRTVLVQRVNPRSGSKSSEIVWYLPYKVVNRALPKLGDASDSVPVNVVDAPPPPLFVPRATLVTEDRDGRQIVTDSIIPEAMPLITTRERIDLKTSVQMAGPLPPLTPATGSDEKAEYGVFLFRGVNPRTTAFSVYLSGFSSAYQVGKSTSGEPPVLRRTIVVPYRRLADQYDQFEKEIRQRGEPKWIYVPDDLPVARQ